MMDSIFGKFVSKDFCENKLNWDSNNSLKKTSKKFSKIANDLQKKCYICSSKRSKKLTSFYEIDYLQCQNCSHVYTNKRLSKSDLIKFYEKNASYSTSAYANKKIIQLRNEVVEPKINFISKYSKGKNWLDIGSGDGSTVSVIKDKKFNAMGIELSEHSQKFAKKVYGLELYPRSLDSFSKDNSKSWDIISFFGVLEHLTNPIESLKTSYDLLGKNGIIAVAVPNYESLSSYVQILMKYPDRHLVPLTHIMMFTQKSLKKAFSKAGFKPIASWCYGADMIELLRFLLKENKKIRDSQLKDLLLSKINEIQLVFDKSGYGDEILFVGKKIN